MNTRQHIQKKHPSQSTYTPVQNLYQTRAFDIQQQPSHSSSGQENVDLDADHEQSQYKLYNLPYIPVNAPGTEPPPPIQTQLNSGEPTNYYQQGSADVAWYNRPTYPNIPVNAPGTEPPPPIQTQLNSGEPTNYYQQGSADVPWYNRPTYPNIPVNAPGTEPPPPIQTQLNSGEPTNYYQQGSADVPWYNRPTYPNIPVNAPGTEPPPPIQTQLNSGEPTNYYQQGSADVAWYNRPTYPNIPVNAPGTEPPPPIQTKLTIGQPGDKYEQEADQVASQVVQQINSPVPVQSAQGQTVQREDATPFEEEQVQAKSISDTIQREELPEEEELQMSPMLQRQGQGGMAATPDLETSINQARGGGMPLAENLQRSMGKAMGADFSGVKVHTDSQSDQLNQSIQARAFTTGQDVFFRQGEYNPGSRGGQELLAHELTHVVQQNGHTVQRQKDGSGKHGSQEAGIGNRLKKQWWYRVADTAESVGLTNAARHMRHYLNNSGTPLNVNVDQMLRDLPGLQKRFENEKSTAKNEANNRIAAANPHQPITFTLEGDRRNYYATKSESPDWFYAIGGFTYWYTATVEVIPSSKSSEKPTVKMTIYLNVLDKYNWDKGKSVTIGPVTVSDESLGELHKTGLAQEYEVNGTNSSISINWTDTAKSPTPISSVANDRDGGRMDQQRDRSSDRRQDRELRDTSNRKQR